MPNVIEAAARYRARAQELRQLSQASAGTSAHGDFKYCAEQWERLATRIERYVGGTTDWAETSPQKVVEAGSTIARGNIG